jgi:hypothetical protein
MAPPAQEKKKKSVLAKALALNSKPTEESFPELPTVLIWFRFLLAVTYGTFLGMKDIRSGAMILQSLNLVAFVPVVYCRLYLGTGADVFPSEIIFSGLFPAVCLSLLIWIYFFTAQHEADEAKLVELLLVTPSVDEGEAANVLSQEPATTEAEIPVEEPEF